ncbi:MAG TPA: DUF4384 domain-containing protein [Polyangiaceae bacterium]|nr:DUF4384 domain-containing protein [Polyangiaceae bacterium]
MRTEFCPSDLELDRYVLSELSPSRQQALEVHLRSCASCQAHLSEVERATQRLQHSYPTFTALHRKFRGQRAPASTRRPRMWTLASLGVAAAVTLSLWWSDAMIKEATTQSNGLRSKGSLSFSYHVKRADHVFEGGMDEVLKSGDAIQFTVRTNQPGYLAIFSVDGKGTTNVYYPLGALAASLPSGHHTLPLSTVLDEVLGHERIWAMFCGAPFELEPLRKKLQAEGPGALDQKQCRSEVLSFEKRAPGAPR